MEIETFENFDSRILARTSSESDQTKFAITHSLENIMELQTPIPASLHSMGNAPSSTPDSSIRIALNARQLHSNSALRV
jgi:hypothetical protein